MYLSEGHLLTVKFDGFYSVKQLKGWSPQSCFWNGSGVSEREKSTNRNVTEHIFSVPLSKFLEMVTPHFFFPPKISTIAG